MIREEQIELLYGLVMKKEATRYDQAATRRPRIAARGDDQLSRDQSGSMALLFAMALPILFAATAGAIDYATALHQKSRLQRVVDAAALAAASELSMSNSKTDNVSSVVQTLVDNYLRAAYSSGKYPTPTVKTAVNTQPLQVEVHISQKFQSYFGDPLGLQTADLTADSVAQVMGKPNVCVLVLHPSENGALSLEQSARVTGTNCGIFSNSTHSNGIMTKNNAVVKAATICSAGGIQGGGNNFDPPPYMDCPSFDDPLAERPEPSVGTCASTKPTIIKSSQLLTPGTYCGLTISRGAEVKLSPGTYVIKNNPLIVEGGGQLKGLGVGFYLTGRNAYLDFDADSTVSIEAPTTGTMAGLLIFASRADDTW